MLSPRPVLFGLALTMATAAPVAAQSIVEELERGARDPGIARVEGAAAAPDLDAVVGGAARRGLPSLGLTQPAWDEPVAAPGQVAPGHLVVHYDPYATTTVRVGENLLTTIRLPGCERIAAVRVGDAHNFEVTQESGNELSVYAWTPGVDTSLEVRGRTGNRYVFLLRSQQASASDVADIAVTVQDRRACGVVDRVAGRPAPGAPVGTTATGAPMSGRPEPFAPADLDFDRYRIFVGEPGHAVIAPDRVYTDGVTTYLDYGRRAERMERPAVFAVVDGVDEPVDVRVTGARGQIVAVPVIGDLSLRSGQAVVCIRLRHRDPPPEVTVDESLGDGW